MGIQTENNSSDLDAKGLLHYFNQAWRKKSKKIKELTFEPTHSNTEHTSQNENTGTDGVGVCQADGMSLNVFEVGFTLMSTG